MSLGSGTIFRVENFQRWHFTGIPANHQAVFFGDEFDMRGGIHLNGPDGTVVRLFVVLSVLLQDGGAHKLVWGCKGDCGTKCCMLCANLVAEASGLTDEDGLDILVCSVIHEHQLIFSSDAGIRASIARLDRYKLTGSPGDFKLRQQAIGFTHQSDGLLNDATLESAVFPASQYCHDWMHCIFASGVFNIVVFLCFQAAKEARTNVWAVLRDCVLKCTWPHTIRFKPSVSDRLSADRVKAHTKAKQFKCTASDGLSLLPVMCLFVQSVLVRVNNIDHRALNALVLLNDLVDAMVAVTLGVVSVQYLRERVREFLVAVETAGWRPHLIPKFHWLIRLIRALDRWGKLPTCWVHERKHRMVKRYGEDILNTRAYAASVLSETISHQLVEVGEDLAFDISPGLLNARPATKKERDFCLNLLGMPHEDASVLTSV